MTHLTPLGSHTLVEVAGYQWGPATLMAYRIWLPGGSDHCTLWGVRLGRIHIPVWLWLPTWITRRLWPWETKSGN